jgi:hypothetical protein
MRSRISSSTNSFLYANTQSTSAKSYIRASSLCALLFLLCILQVSCNKGASTSLAPTPAKQDLETKISGERGLPTREEWIHRILRDGGQEPDLVEAATVLANSKTRAPRPYSAIYRSLEPLVINAKSKLSPSATTGDKIDALNAEVVPAIRRGRTDEFSWLFEVFGKEEGGCLPSVLLYLVAADMISLDLKAVCLPAHIFLCHIGPEGRRNIETTDKGQHLTIPEYVRFLTRNTFESEKFPEDEKSLEKYFSPITRRQFVALLLCQGEGGMTSKDTEPLELAARVAPDFVVPLKKLAGFYYTRNRGAEAEIVISKIIELAPYMPGPYELRGLIRLDQRKLKQALEDIESGLRLSPHYARFYWMKSSVFYLSESHAEALDLVNRALNLDPREARYWRLRGLIFLELEKYKEALEDFRKSIELDPTAADTYKARAELWDSLGEREKRDADLKKAEELKSKR